MKKFLLRLYRLFMPILDKPSKIFIQILVKIFKAVAMTGVGPDVCLKNGFLPVRIHYYQPIPDLDDLEQRRVWDKQSALAGIDFRPEQQVQLLRDLGARYGDECNWPANPTHNLLEFYTENGTFSFGCAASLHTIIRNYRPAKIIEIGSGNSSKVISAALLHNTADYTIIDPYPKAETENLPGVSRVIKERVEITDIKRFQELGPNDILFIDSGHTVRTGSDVNFLYLDVLPRLSSGVIVHIHDIGLPYEYPKVYFTNPAFRVFWTEAYLLQAFLCLNPRFEIMLAMNYLMTNRLDEFRQAFLHYDPAIHKATSGSFWMRRVS